MAGKCTICAHPKRRLIDAEIVRGKESIRNIAKRFIIGYSAIQRHKDHIKEAVELVKKKEGKTAFVQFNEMLKEAESKYRETKGNLQVGWFREWRGMMELGFKLGMEAQREKREDKDMTVAVRAIVDKEFEE